MKDGSTVRQRLFFLVKRETALLKFLFGIRVKAFEPHVFSYP
ncbi:hypothetical protein EV132_1677 [Rhizobium sullae]|uniref:Uncharacterized protein n=1 Tax=Rhizobium sullae TaxID=50338 RepID=A0A4R3PPU8_RHISU|nr:hypothetical protein EV132_1677 [Rhizobium sullae]